MRAQLSEAQLELTQLRAELASMRTELLETTNVADAMSASLQTMRERARLHLMHVQRLLAAQAQLLQDRRALGMLRQRLHLAAELARLTRVTPGHWQRRQGGHGLAEDALEVATRTGTAGKAPPSDAAVPADIDEAAEADVEHAASLPA